MSTYISTSATRISRFFLEVPAAISCKLRRFFIVLLLGDMTVLAGITQFRAPFVEKILAHGTVVG